MSEVIIRRNKHAGLFYHGRKYTQKDENAVRTVYRCKHYRNARPNFTRTITIEKASGRVVTFGVHHCEQTTVEVSEGLLNVTAEMRGLAVERSMTCLGDSPSVVYESIFAEIARKFSGLLFLMPHQETIVNLSFSRQDKI
jgi:hypothetical protein